MFLYVEQELLFLFGEVGKFIIFFSLFSVILRSERRLSLKRDSLERMRRGSRVKTATDEDAQFGFENRAFMSQHVYLDNKFESEPQRYCSLAQFVEGNDIARRSFKRARPASKLSKEDKNRQSVLLEEKESDLATTPSQKGSTGSLNKLEKELSNVSTSTLKALEEKEKDDTVSIRVSGMWKSEWLCCIILFHISHFLFYCLNIRVLPEHHYKSFASVLLSFMIFSLPN